MNTRRVVRLSVKVLITRFLVWSTIAVEQNKITIQLIIELSTLIKPLTSFATYRHLSYNWTIQIQSLMRIDNCCLIQLQHFMIYDTTPFVSNSIHSKTQFLVMLHFEVDSIHNFLYLKCIFTIQ